MSKPKNQLARDYAIESVRARKCCYDSHGPNIFSTMPKL